MKRLFFFLIICTQLFSLSCRKYLDKPTSTNLAYPTTIANCQALLDNSRIMNEGTPFYMETSADDYFVTQAQFNSASPIAREVYLWGMPYLSTSNDWIVGYQPVYHANVCLENIDKIEKTNNVLAWNNVKGSAYFFRAYYFLQMIWEYGKAYDESTSNSDLGIALKMTTDLYEPTVRSSVKQTYELIINDAKQSILYLPDTSNHPLRPSKVAAYGLLARTYLSMRMYDSAGKYADNYLTLKSRLIDYNGDADLVNSLALDISPFRLYNKESAFYSSAADLLDLPSTFNSNIDTLLYESYQANDLRKSAFFTGSGTYKTFKGTYSQDVRTRFSGIATDEMYLISAECFARRGDKDNALANLNTLLVKRWKAGTFVPVSAADPAQALQIILQERRKELLMRGLRWIDLKRLNKESIHAVTLTRIVNGQNYILPPNDNRYALPIPEVLIAITGMMQNPR